MNYFLKYFGEFGLKKCCKIYCGEILKYRPLKTQSPIIINWLFCTWKHIVFVNTKICITLCFYCLIPVNNFCLCHFPTWTPIMNATNILTFLSSIQSTSCCHCPLSSHTWRKYVLIGAELSWEKEEIQN